MSQETQTSGLKHNWGNSCLIMSRWTKISLSWDREYKSAKRSSEQLIQWLLPGNTVSDWWLWNRKKKQKPRVLTRFIYFVPIDTGAEALHTRWATATHSFVCYWVSSKKEETYWGWRRVSGQSVMESRSSCCHYESQYSRVRCWCKGKWFICRCCISKRGTHV